MPSGSWTLLFWTVTLAAWLFAHVVAVVRSVRSRELGTAWKWASLLPPVTAWTAWKAGARVTAVLWAAFAVLYVVLRLVR